MHKNLLLAIAAEQRKELRHLFIARRFPSAHRNIYEAQSKRFRLLAFPISRAGIFATQIDDGGHAQLFQFRHSFFPRLRAAKKKIVHSTAVT